MKKPHIPGVTADYAIVLLQNSGWYMNLPELHN